MPVPDCPTYVGLCATLTGAGRPARTVRYASRTQTNVLTVCCTNCPRSAAILANYHCVDSLSLHSTTGRYSSHENYAKEWRGSGGVGVSMFYAQSTISVISGRNTFCFHIVIVKKCEHAKTSIIYIYIVCVYNLKTGLKR